jgi:Fic family protein
MTWNWQLPDWPRFTWHRPRLDAAEQQFLVGEGTFFGAIKHLGDEDRNQLTVEAMSTEALTTSEIEGEILDRASVQSSIRRQLGLAADNRRAAPAERGVSEMMVNLYKTFAAPLSDDTLFEWQCMLMSGWQDLTDIGRYRTSSEPMQVLSAAMG